MLSKKLLVTMLTISISTVALLQASEMQAKTVEQIAPKISDTTPFAQAVLDDAARIFSGKKMLSYDFNTAAKLGLLDESVRLNLFEKCKNIEAGLFTLTRDLIIDMSAEAIKKFIKMSLAFACEDPQYKDLVGRPSFTNESDVDAYGTWLINHSSMAFWPTYGEATCLQYATWTKEKNLVQAFVELGADVNLGTKEILSPVDLINGKWLKAVKTYENIRAILGCPLPKS